MKNKEVIQGRSPQEIHEDHILYILGLPDFNVSRADAVRYQIQLERINVYEKEVAMKLMDMEYGTKEYMDLFHNIRFR
jgi:hypothetical protein